MCAIACRVVGGRPALAQANFARGGQYVGPLRDRSWRRRSYCGRALSARNLNRDDGKTRTITLLEEGTVADSTIVILSTTVQNEQIPAKHPRLRARSSGV